ncbi:hypothetical protein HBN07_26280 [Klebsiella pneumoniae]|nr:hypothetical protein [Klebsiella pneumoniae]
MFYTGLANFDPEVFNEPFQFIPGRKEKPLSFGGSSLVVVAEGMIMVCFIT